VNQFIPLAAAIHLTWQKGAAIVAASTWLQTGTCCILVWYGESNAKQHQHCR